MTFTDYETNDSLPPPDKLIDLCDQFEALPLTNAFDALVNNHLAERKLTYRSDAPIHLENDALSESLPETFFFPHSSMVDDIEFTMVSDAANVWSVNGSFKVGDQIYKIIAADGGCKIEGEDSTGNSLSTTTTNLQLLGLLARLIGKENDTDSTLVISHLNKIPTYDAFCSLLTALGSLNGRVVSTRTSELPHEHGDRSLLVVTSEQESPRISGVNTKFFLNWELLHRNTETTATLNEIRNGGPDYSGLHVRYIERKGTAVPIEDYLLSQQIPELFSIDSQSDIPTLIDPHDNQAAWIYATTTFMTTIGPLLEPYRHLDQPPEEIITEERP